MAIILDEEENDFDKFDTLPEVDVDKFEKMSDNNKTELTTKEAEADQLLPSTEWQFIASDPGTV